MNTTIIIGILMAAAVVAAVYFYTKHVKKNRVEKKVEDFKNSFQWDIPFDWQNSEPTPNLKIPVIWNGDPFGSEANKKLAFEAVEIGYKNLFAAMQPRFPTWDFNPSLFMFAFMEGNSKTEYGAESITSKGGVEASGFTMGVTDNYPMTLSVIVSQKANDWRHIADTMHVAWYEGEHNIEDRSDSSIALEKSGAVPGLPDAHPHWNLPDGVAMIPPPQTNTAVGFASLIHKVKCGQSAIKSHVSRAFTARGTIEKKDVGFTVEQVLSKTAFNNLPEATKRALQGR